MQPQLPQTNAAKPGSHGAPYSVSRVVTGVNRTLERVAGTIWVEGEVSSLSKPASGHLYFSLKDKRAEVRAVMWRSEVAKLKFAIEDGMSLLARVRLGLYEQGGKFQLYVQAAEPAGLGADALALAQLRQKLATEGLFDARRKRRLKRLPKRVGLVTSKTGAAVRDIVRAVHRRYPVPIVIAHAHVQGKEAPRQIVDALALMAHANVDVVIIGRGGGSAVDLSAFNDERVVRAIAACAVPTISAVGHEVDITLADLVADHRAATPTMAGEMSVPVLSEMVDLVCKQERRLERELRYRLDSARQQLDGLSERGRGQTVERIARLRAQLAALERSVARAHPHTKLEAARREFDSLENKLGRAWVTAFDQRRQAFKIAAGKLASLSPLQVLERGYAIAQSHDRVLVDTLGVAPGDPLTVRLRRGELTCKIESVWRSPGEMARSDSSSHGSNSSRNGEEE